MVPGVSTEPTPVEIPPHVLDYIGERQILTVATASPGGIPHAATFLYVNEGGCLYFWTRPETTTAKHVEQNPVVSFTIDEYSDDLGGTRGLQGRGECSMLLSGQAIARMAGLFGRKFAYLSRGTTTSTSFFRIVPIDLRFTYNTSTSAEQPDGAFGAGFHTEPAYSVFAELPVGRFESIDAPLGTVTAAAGEVVVRQGAPADKFFIVVDGEVEVLDEGSGTARLLGRGHLFGETAIMFDRPRSATVRATRRTTLLSLDRDTFRDLVAQSLGTTGDFDKVIRARLVAHADGA